MPTVREVKERLMYLNKGKWRRRIASGEYCWVEMDLTDQFTLMNRSRVLKSLKRAIRHMKRKGIEGVTITRRKIDKRLDGVRMRKDRNFVFLSWETIRKYVEFEFEVSMVTLPGKTIRQIEGVPMGGFVSAPLAVMDSCRREHEGRRIWRRVGGKPTWMTRYRDDIRALVHRDNVGAGVEAFREELCKMYGPGVGIKLERQGERWCHFVGVWVLNCAGGVMVGDHNKNASIMEKKLTSTKTRWPSRKGSWDERVFTDTMAGALTSLKRRVSGDGMLLVGLLQYLWEWRRLSYERKWIVEALCRVGLKEYRGYVDIWGAPLWAPPTTASATTSAVHMLNSENLFPFCTLKTVQTRKRSVHK